jgi:hypothetical protein
MSRSSEEGVIYELALLRGGTDRLQLDPARRYSVMRIGDARFTYSDPAAYLRALGQAWSAGFSPQPCPSALGRELDP